MSGPRNTEGFGNNNILPAKLKRLQSKLKLGVVSPRNSEGVGNNNILPGAVNLRNREGVGNNNILPGAVNPRNRKGVGNNNILPVKSKLKSKTETWRCQTKKQQRCRQ